MTVADLDALPERGEMFDGVHYELVDGVLKGLTRSSVAHQDALFALHLLLRTGVPSDLHVVQGIGVVLADDQRAAPDLVVIRTVDRTLVDVPAGEVVLAAEIVSPSSRSTDRFVKPALYSEAGIPCYVRVELDPPLVVAYRPGTDGVYEHVGRAEPGEVLTLTEPFPIRIDPAALVR